MNRLVCIAVVLVLGLAQSAAAAAPKPTLGQLEHEVMCPTCHTLLELSSSPVADRIRAFIRRRIADGDSEAEIKRRLVAEFGDGVLAAPPAHGFGLLAWLLPGLGLGGGAFVLAAVARAWRRAGDAGDATPLDPAAAARLDRELARFDA